MRLYKVITQRDEFFKSKFNPEALQNLINKYASDGWRVVSLTATDVGSWVGSFLGKGGGASRQELIVLLERKVSEEEALKLQAEAREKKLAGLAQGICPNCDGYNAWLKLPDGSQKCEVCGETYSRQALDKALAKA